MLINPVLLYRSKKAKLPSDNLYNGYVVNDIRGVAPTGWHIPTKTEFETLIAYLGGSEVAGGKLKTVGLTDWDDPNTGATNEVEFALKGIGGRPSSFIGQKTNSYTWSATTGDWFDANYLIECTNASAAIGYGFRDHSNVFGASVRCIKDDATNSGSVTDIEGHTYTTVKIGDQVWMAEDLRVKSYNNGDSIPNITDNAAWAALTTGAYCTYNNL